MAVDRYTTAPKMLFLISYPSFVLASLSLLR
nr:MAG TPA: hypothetical protein [Caudoviricetes sp.]